MSLKFRPFAAIGFTALLSLFLIVYFGELFAPCFIGAGILLFLISLLFRSVREQVVPIYMSVALIFSGLMYYYAVSKPDAVKPYYNKTAQISGIIIDIDESGENGRYYYILDLNDIDGKSVDSKLRLSLPEKLPAEHFDVVSLKANVYEISAENYAIKLNYYADGIFLGAYTNAASDTEISVERGQTTEFRKFVLNSKETIEKNIADNIGGESGATVIAMLLGDKSGLSSERVASFREVGIAPIFAVSGMHLSIWVLGLFSFLKSFGIRKRLNSVISIMFTVFFMFLAGLTPSVCRAGVMMILLLCGNLFKRKSDSLNSLGFVAFLLIIINPFTAVDVGFILSFSATLGIVTIVPLCEKFVFARLPDKTFYKIVHTLLLPLIVSLSASIAVLPATIILVGYVSVLSVLSNIALSYMAMMSMVMGGIGSVSAGIPYISDILFIFSGALANIMLMIVDAMREWPLTVMSTENLFWKIGALASIAVIVVSVCNFKGKNIFRAVCVGLAANILVFSLSAHFYYYDLTQVRILNIDGGIAVVVYSDGRKIVLTGKADSYDKIYGISDSLDYYDRKDPDLLLIADKNALDDNSNFIIMKNYQFNRIVLPYSNQSLESFIPEDRIFASPNADIEVFEDDMIRYMSCESFSLAHCTFDDIEVLFLFSSAKKAEIPQEYLDADYLVCCGYIPSDINPASYSKVVVCGNSKSSEGVAEYVSHSGGRALALEDSNAVLLNIREDSHKFIILED